jgi:DNA-binding MarR family transcriptional regulator
MLDTTSYEVARIVADNCLCVRVQRASRAIARHFDRAFRPLDLNNWQFSLLMHLNRPAPLTISELAERLAMDRTTTTANLKPLERRGLIAIHRDDKDARAKRVVLTESGRKLLAQAFEHWRAANEVVVARLQNVDLGALHATLRTIAET